jgi:hypothetical protein
MVGGGDDRMDASGVAERREDVRACLVCGFCEEGGGVMEDERSEDVPGAAIMDVAGEVDRWRSCLAGKSSS